MKKLLLFAGILLACSIGAQTMVPLPAYTGTFSGSVRGYYFTAPTCFTITGVRVPTDVGTADQSIAIVRFWNNQIPPLYSATTNAFTVLYLTQNNTNAGVLPVNIQVEQGDVIGVLGQRGTANSYGTNPYSSNIAGFPITLNRLGMQFQLGTTPPQQLWGENGGSLSRVELYYDSTITFTASHTVLNQSDVSFMNNADSTFISVWDFGDGSPLQTASSPTHTYATGGTYMACNYITTSCGTDTICMSVTVCGAAVTTSNYAASTMGAMAMFSNSSANSTTWLWDFGDAATSTAQNPTHTYAASGTYYVCLTAYNGTCDTAVFCDSVTVCIPADAVYTATDSGGGLFGFSNLSTEATTWYWDFGDGNNSTLQSPSHTYALNGTYNICLIATGCSSDTTCTTITTCPEALSAMFSSSDTATTATFSNGSVSATSYMWDFGDSLTDTSANPVHVYANTGLYTVCLTAWNLCGDSTTYCDTVLLIITFEGDMAVQSVVSVYPNPVHESSLIQVTTPYQGNFVFEVYDATGKLVSVQNGVLNSPMAFHRGNLAAGNYTYKVITAKEVAGTGTIIIR